MGMAPNGRATRFINATDHDTLVVDTRFWFDGNSCVASSVTAKTEFKRVSGICAKPPFQTPDRAEASNPMIFGSQIENAPVCHRAGRVRPAQVNPAITDPRIMYCRYCGRHMIATNAKSKSTASRIAFSGDPAVCILVPITASPLTASLEATAS